MADFIPTNESEYGDWLQNLWMKLPTHGVTLGMTAAEISALRGEIAAQQALHSAAEAARGAALAAEVEERNGRTALNTLLRGKIANWKTLGGYSEAMGQEMKIIGSGTSVDEENYKPEIAAKVVGGEIRITFKKKGVDGVNVYCRLRGTTGWRKLAFDSSSPYVDTEPLANPAVPEMREYRARGVIKDTEIGQDSDIVSVTFAG